MFHFVDSANKYTQYKNTFLKVMDDYDYSNTMGIKNEINSDEQTLLIKSWHDLVKF